MLDVAPRCERISENVGARCTAQASKSLCSTNVPRVTPKFVRNDCEEDTVKAKLTGQISMTFLKNSEGHEHANRIRRKHHMEDVDPNKMTDVDTHTEMHVDPGEAGRSSNSNR